MRKTSLFASIFIIFSLVFITACSENRPEVDNESNEGIEEDQEDEGNDQTNPETEENHSDERDQGQNEGEIVAENEAFRIFQPAPNSELDHEFTVIGQARVFEATIQYEFKDGDEIIDKGFVTASQGAPDWGDFEINFQFDELTNPPATIIIYEESAKDGSRLYELSIPVYEKD
ncbi:Gmad2 immunoglobulin-like domain-containing protein [Amphibacillus sp. MSJ-3]|uniref:Gmad2 immunoglobulin-like domain-containing protein n=1 Tax=Amphibacillus sp. MSJ-3 TaxID=2841505 RepID=UPI001C0F1212|nr:Gmad2 immunoglobulin-like domain-containing protein [Amphibacillus sp. MSJ-3]MBU5594306.1 Gmad2 immunoglobulin-like domain-containing protein [Amphibacillus sp. MSJ-3]